MNLTLDVLGKSFNQFALTLVGLIGILYVFRIPRCGCGRLGISPGTNLWRRSEVSMLCHMHLGRIGHLATHLLPAWLVRTGFLDVHWGGHATRLQGHPISPSWWRWGWLCVTGLLDLLLLLLLQLLSVQIPVSACRFCLLILFGRLPFVAPPYVETDPGNDKHTGSYQPPLPRVEEL